MVFYTDHFIWFPYYIVRFKLEREEKEAKEATRFHTT